MLLGMALAEEDDFSMSELMPDFSAGERSDDDDVLEEEGYDELIPLIGITDAQNVEGMGLEELTETYLNATMKEYYNGSTGLCIQYPATFSFDETGNGTVAVSADGKAFLVIESSPMEYDFDIDQMTEALKQAENCTVKCDELTGVIRRDIVTDDTIMLDLYLPTESYLHHVSMTWPAAQQEIYGVFVDYMINSFTSDETEMG